MDSIGEELFTAVRPIIRIVRTLSLIAFPFCGAVSGLAFADVMFPRSDIASMVCAHVGIVAAVGVWLASSHYLFRSA
jgi:hypothetical protein